jgi:N-acetylmuramoyl-L-alanine amidase
VIVVDPGHGGARGDGRPEPDRGVCVGGAEESYLTMLYASELVCALAALGVSAWLTRTCEALSLTQSDRARLANQRKAKAFVSLHCASSPNPDACGLRVFHCRGSVRGERLAQAVLAAAVPAVAAETERSGVYQDQTIHCGYRAPAQAHADQLREASRGEWWRVDTRVRERFGNVAAYRRLPELRETRMPAVLVELDYLTNPLARARLQDATYRRRLCAAIAEGLDTWLWPAPARATLEN